LAAEAAGDAVFVGEEDAFVHLLVAVVEEELIYAVGAVAVVGLMERGDDVLGGELFAEGFGEVAHFVQIEDGVFVDPAGELGATVRLLSELGGDLGKFGRRQTDEARRARIHRASVYLR
jgi:hypothetical protein